jgi:hypothetical protein
VVRYGVGGEDAGFLSRATNGERKRKRERKRERESERVKERRRRRVYLYRRVRSGSTFVRSKP